MTVPRAYNVRLETAGGDITVSGIAGRVEGETSGGNVSIDHVEGVAKSRPPVVTSVWTR